MAKLGTLVATGGLWQGRRLLSEAWIRESTQMLPTNWVFGHHSASYGYLWWGLPQGVIMAAGTGGQFIFVVPDRQLVVATNAQNDVLFDAQIRILYDHILPALQ